MEQVLLALVEKLPTTFILIGCVGYSIHKICLSDKGTFNKVVRFLNKKDKETKKDINEIKEEIRDIKKEVQENSRINKEQNEFLNLLLGEKGEERS